MSVEITLAMLADPNGPCSHWDDAGWCGATEGVRRYREGSRCPGHAPNYRIAAQRKPIAEAIEPTRSVVPAASPIVMVSSRDGAPVPDVAGATRLARAAEAAGWAPCATYAVAEVPATSRRAAHQLATVAVRFGQGLTRGWACWQRIDDGNWRFAEAWLGLRRLGARELTAALFEVRA